LTSSNYNWSDIARAYSKGEQSVTQICAQFGVSRSSLYRHAKRQNWPSRLKTVRSAQQNFLDAMFDVLNKQLEQVDRRITADGAVDAVALGNIAKTFEKLVELRGVNKKPEKRRRESSAATALREMLAQNLERLNDQN